MRSWLGMSLVSEGDLAGLLVLEKAEPRSTRRRWNSLR